MPQDHLDGLAPSVRILYGPSIKTWRIGDYRRTRDDSHKGFPFLNIFELSSSAGTMVLFTMAPYSLVEVLAVSM